MPIVQPTPEGIERAARILRGGGLVAFPTETVYGLGANALDAAAVAAVFETKGRPHFDPLIVHVHDATMLASVALDVPDAARALMDRFWPGPLTLILRKRPEVPDLVTAGLPTVAVRMPSHPVAVALLAQTGLPLAAPSANPFGYISPTRAEHVERQLGARVAMVLDGGASPVGIESTIVALDPEPVVLRPGAIALDEIEAVAGPLKTLPPGEAAPLAPGRLEHHYAPRKPLRVVPLADVPLKERAGAAALAWRTAPPGYAHARALSARGDLREAAARLFELLHELDALDVTRIDADPVPERGLGIAIADRLRRASGRF